MTELDFKIQQLPEDDEYLVADVDKAAGVQLVAERAVKMCQGMIKDLQPPSTSGAAAIIIWHSDHKAPQDDRSFIQR